MEWFAGPDRLVFGTDLCISKLASVLTRNLKKDGDFTEEAYRKMSYGNCLELFPALQAFYNE
jgi:predicted TIM-barrel fold metal-dependent hydrolase